MNIILNIFSCVGLGWKLPLETRFLFFKPPGKSKLSINNLIKSVHDILKIMIKYALEHEMQNVLNLRGGEYDVTPIYRGRVPHINYGG